MFGKQRGLYGTHGRVHREDLRLAATISHNHGSHSTIYQVSIYKHTYTFSPDYLLCLPVPSTPSISTRASGRDQNCISDHR